VHHGEKVGNGQLHQHSGVACLFQIMNIEGGGDALLGKKAWAEALPEQDH